MICKAMREKYGEDSKYTKDCLIRAVKGKSYDDAVAILDWKGDPPIVIQAGIGTLVIGPDREEFTPAPSIGKKVGSLLMAGVNPVLAPLEERDARRAICATCTHWNAKKSLCSACGCKTTMKTALKSQKCPRGLW